MKKKIFVAACAAVMGCVFDSGLLQASQAPVLDSKTMNLAAEGDEVPQNERNALLTKIENKLNHSLIFEARIQQEDVHGRQSFGKVWMKRPGKMRLVYDPPATMYLVANSGKVVYQDPQDDQTTEIPIDRTPLGLLLAKHISLHSGVNISDFRQANGVVALTLSRSASKEDGSLTLYFQKSPLTLMAWTVIDAQGKRVNVFLKDIHNVKDISEQLFKLPAEAAD